MVSARVLVVYTPEIAGIAPLLAGLPATSVQVAIARDQSAIRAIGAALATHGPVSQLVLIGHGRPGAIDLGTGFDRGALLDHSRTVAGWRAWFAPGATIQILGCDTGAGSEGRRLIDALAALTGAGVAAADQPLGRGYWQLPVSAGVAERVVPIAPAVQAAWGGVLVWVPGASASLGNDTFIGSAAADVVDALDGNDSIRGDLGDDSLSGGAQDDTIDGGDGVDSVYGNNGDDILVVNSPTDLAVGEVYDGGNGLLDRLRLNATSAHFDLAVGTTLVDIEVLELPSAASSITASHSQVSGLTSLIGGGGTQTLRLTGATVDFSSTVISGFERFELFSAITLLLPTAHAQQAIVAGSTGNDSIRTGAGGDSIEAGPGTDSIDAGDGDDTVVVNGNQLGTGELIDGGAGYDFINFNSPFAVIMNGGTVTISGSSGTIINVERFSGNVGADKLVAPATGGYLDGSSSADTLIGGLSADTLIGGADADSVVGAGGNDLIILFGTGQVSAVETVDGGGDSDTLRLDQAGTYDLSAWTITDIESLQFSVGGSTATLPGTVAAGLTSIIGSAGTDVLNLSGGTVDLSAKTVIGIEQFELLAGGTIALPATYATAVRLFGSSGNDTLVGGNGADTLIGGAFADSLIGGGGADSLVGGGGGDVFTGGAGADVVFAASVGDFTGAQILDMDYGDLVRIAGITFTSIGPGDGTGMAAYGVHVQDLGGSRLLLFETTGDAAFDGSLTISGAFPISEFTVTGGSIGRAAPPVALGTSITAPTLSLTGTLTSPGTASLDGSGVASVTYEGNLVDPGVGNTALTKLDASALAGFGAKLEGNANNNTLTGSAFADTLNGATGDDYLDGGQQADSLLGGIGVDTILGGDGNDTLVFFPGDATGTESVDGGAASDQVVYLASGKLDFSGGTLINVELVTGSALKDTLVLTASQASAFTAGSTINLAGGSEDILEIAGAAGAIDPTGWGVVNVEYLRITPTAPVTITDRTDMIIEIAAGSTLPATIIGSTADDITFGADGADSILGNNGADQLVGDGGNDTLVGGDAADVLFGGAGSDSLVSGSGADTILGDEDGDIIQLHGGGGEIAFGGAGQDTISAPGGTVGAVMIGDTNLSGGDGDNLTGSGGADTIFGCGGADTILGLEGTDRLLGGTGADTLTGGVGNDTLWGNDDADRFRLDADSSVDVIADFATGVDVIEFFGFWSGLNDVASLTQTVVPGGLRISIGGVTAVELVGITAMLPAGDFIIPPPP